MVNRTYVTSKFNYLHRPKHLTFLTQNGIQAIVLKFLGGSSLPSNEIVSRHIVTSQFVMFECYTLCEGEEKCFGFNYRTNKDVENCQLTNVTDNKSNSKKGDWILMRKDEAVSGKF